MGQALRVEGEIETERDELMLGVAVEKVGRVTESRTVDRPGETDRAAEAVDLLYALWSAGLAHEVRPADWTAVVNLPQTVVDVLGKRRLLTR